MPTSPKRDKVPLDTAGVTSLEYAVLAGALVTATVLATSYIVGPLAVLYASLIGSLP